MVWFHKLLCDVIQKFIEGKIKKLMIFMPPQHGKSELVSRLLPCILLGLNPNLRLACCTYGNDFAKDFNSDVQKYMLSDEYKELFPNTKLNERRAVNDDSRGAKRNSVRFDIVGYRGFYKSVGVGGRLTGTPVDIGIIDDVIKNPQEADSLTYRNRTWKWYNAVFRTRMHNKSQQLLTFTRWHEDDLAGRILSHPNKSISGGWTIITLKGIKELGDDEVLGEHLSDLGIEFHDPRKVGEALWEKQHAAETLKSYEEREFQAMIQQNPRRTKQGRCIPEYSICEEMPKDLKKVGLGMDFGWSSPTAVVKCGIKEVGKEIHLYVDEVVYGTKIQNKKVAELLRLNGIKNIQMLCDSARGDSIDDLNNIFAENQMSIRCLGAKKGAGSIKSGLLLINGCKLFITRRSVNLKHELDNYSYIDLGSGNYSDDPIDEFNHAIDAMRYWVLHNLTKPTNIYISY